MITQFCVQSYNGNLQSACTSFVAPPKWPGFKRTIGDRGTSKFDPAPLKLKDNTTVLFLANTTLPQLWEQVGSAAMMDHEVGSVDGTST